MIKVDLHIGLVFLGEKKQSRYGNFIAKITTIWSLEAWDYCLKEFS